MRFGQLAATRAAAALACLAFKKGSLLSAAGRPFIRTHRWFPHALQNLAMTWGIRVTAACMCRRVKLQPRSCMLREHCLKRVVWVPARTNNTMSYESYYCMALFFLPCPLCHHTHAIDYGWPSSQDTRVICRPVACVLCTRGSGQRGATCTPVAGREGVKHRDVRAPEPSPPSCRMVMMVRATWRT